MLWAAATLCFFGFFRAGEITISSLSAFDQNKHLAWGDVAIDNPESPQTLQVHLKWSKTDKYGMGLDVFIGKTDCPLCPVQAVLNFIAIQGIDQGSFFKFKSGNKSYFHAACQSSTTGCWTPKITICWPQF